MPPRRCSGSPGPGSGRRAPKQQGLDHNTPTREDESSSQSRWREETVGP